MSMRRMATNVATLGTLVTANLLIGAESLSKVNVTADQRGFCTAAGKSFTPLGVNYFRPGTGWAPQLWKQFDAAATRGDFQRMKQLGVNCVRVFLTYGSFLTQPGQLDPAGLTKFDQFLSMAEEAGIYVHPTGPDHWEGVPEWVSRDRTADEHLVALEKFWEQLAARYRGRSVIFAYDLLNEPTIPWDSPSLRLKWNPWLQSRYPSPGELATAWNMTQSDVHWGHEEPPTPNQPTQRLRLLDYQRFREAMADEWTRRQVAAIKRGDPHALVTVGCIQWSVPVILPSVQQYAAFRPERQAPLLDFLEIHFYPLAQGFYEYTPEAEAHNLAYLQSIVRETAAWGKPVVLAEFGWYGGGTLTIDKGRHPSASDEDQARWCRRAVEVTEGLATGWLNWGLYDHPQARDVTQLTGLLTVDGASKAWAREFHTLATRFAQQPPMLPPPRELPRLDWDRCLTDPQAGREFLELYRQAMWSTEKP